MPSPVIFIDNPIEKDYSPLIEKVLTIVNGVDRLDIVIRQEITNVTHLNEILYYYYNLVRTAIDGLPLFDYTFSINIIFNISHSKLLKLSSNWNHAFIAQQEQTIFKNIPLVHSPIDIELTASNYPSECKKRMKQFHTTAVGGTFDHLHDGHKILLSMAYFLTSKRLIIGITGSELLKNKKFSEVLEPFHQRQNSVVQFLDLIMDEIVHYEIYQINDICGPTGYIEAIDGLVISHETLSGGEFVNNYRREHGFKELDLTAIKVIGDAESNAENKWKGKISSTDIRQRELERREKRSQN
ncbi:Cytidylyltransferase family protein [Candida parapsilosis]|uniref:CTP_transf_like domain-containing protein n=2 Tax=Candida parapsilosis TaxID=5480 RepID=G8BJX6_CANPC|nr:uncharacterized protein CPAR2_407440 [Candida parapsilosis]KAF6045683.1 Cytidylyltransferase family protein [Candida parapsilosis]KAF6046764.1 Cytidylyltransferase family protein [Candida parapsilosis]KAF6050795.1 Cytidylyltransferase family protein [Candida parapsilosis]KAF6062483.1 Cytidylyltransferase family protein [Candida parapsilosis]KAI5910443.1 Phosphopantetheine adenylyltransferase [Candida parapsilosis]